MKNLLFLSMLLFSIACQAYGELDRRIISTQGYGEVKAPPDQVTINFTARATHSTGKEAKLNVDGQINKFLASLKPLNIPQDDIVASQLQIQPRYEYRSDSGRFFTGYEAFRSISVKLTNLDDLTAVMDTGLSSGINSIDSVNYDSSKKRELQLQAHQMAIADSKAKARILAEAYGAELGPIVRIEYHNDAIRYSKGQSDAGMESMVLARSANQPGVYLPDQLMFVDRIQVIFDLIVNE